MMCWILKINALQIHRRYICLHSQNVSFDVHSFSYSLFDRSSKWMDWISFYRNVDFYTGTILSSFNKLQCERWSVANWLNQMKHSIDNESLTVQICLWQWSNKSLAYILLTFIIRFIPLLFTYIRITGNSFVILHCIHTNTI